MAEQPIDIRIMLDEDDFRALVSGKVVRCGIKVRGAPALVQFALKDIGWDRMVESLRDAVEEHAVAEPFVTPEEFFAQMPAAGDSGEGDDDGA